MISFFSYHSPATSNVVNFFECLKVGLYLMTQFGGDFSVGPLRLVSARSGAAWVGRRPLRTVSVNINYCRALEPLL